MVEKAQRDEPQRKRVSPGVPTCSEYAIEALRRRGALGGSWLALRRLLRCHPFGGAGFDPVEK